jgi:diguanylate cyclase (GGDEF)-like protein
MRSPSDIVVIANPSLLNVRNLVLVVGLLFVFVLAAIARSYSLERNVRRHTTAFADLVKAEADFERRRARILEDINGSRPLAEILEEITALAAFKLNNAHTWCKLTDGACFGDCSSVPDPSRVLQQPIFTRSGPPFGFFYSAIKSAPQPNLELETQSTASRQEALATAAGLASLAIETRRLYVDLRHRSEFDLLTDTQNRFSLNRHLQSLIEEAHKNSTSFGLIYIDLDKFKQVNDQFGHQTGDIYLQHVALRMKHQLRACDMLARLGGDEFAVLTPEVRTRQDVEEIAYRLSRAFDEPFTGEGFHLRGSASIGIALYPIDGLSGEELLQTADAAMYKAKKTRSDHLVSVHPLIQPEFPSQTQA